MTTLAANTLVGASFDEVVEERTFISSIVATYSLRELTAAAGVGPFLVVIAHGDYTDAEIEAVIETTGSWDEGDLVQQEVASRRIRKIGIFESPIGSTAFIALNDGKPIRTKLGWILNQGITLKLCAYNMGSAPVATTVPIIDMQGHANLWPR